MIITIVHLIALALGIVIALASQFSECGEGVCAISGFKYLDYVSLVALIIGTGGLDVAMIVVISLMGKLIPKRPKTEGFVGGMVLDDERVHAEGSLPIPMDFGAPGQRDDSRGVAIAE